MVAFVVTLLITVLAVTRITRLIAVDKISEPARARIVKKLGTGSMIAFGVFCPVCVSVWVAFAVTPFVWFLTAAPDVLGVTSWFGLPATALAVSYLAGWILTKEGE